MGSVGLERVGCMLSTSALRGNPLARENCVKKGQKASLARPQQAALPQSPSADAATMAAATASARACISATTAAPEPIGSAMLESAGMSTVKTARTPAPEGRPERVGAGEEAAACARRPPRSRPQPPSSAASAPR